MLIFPLKFEIVVIWLVLGRQLRKLIAYILYESLEIVITQDAFIKTCWEWFSLFVGYVTVGCILFNFAPKRTKYIFRKVLK